MKIRILESAARDIVEGARFYESREAGLGEYYADSAFADIESLRLYAGIHEKHFGLYRMLGSRFPIAIYYDYDGSESTVRAVVGTSRNPGWIRGRVSSSE